MLRIFYMFVDKMETPCRPYAAIRVDRFGKCGFVTRDLLEVAELLGPDHEAIMTRRVDARWFVGSHDGLIQAVAFAVENKDLRLRPPTLTSPNGSPRYCAIWRGRCPVEHTAVVDYVTSDEAVYRGLYMFRDHYGAASSTFEEALAYTRLDEEQIKTVAVQQRPPGCGKLVEPETGISSHGDGTSLHDTHIMTPSPYGGFHLGPRRGMQERLEDVGKVPFLTGACVTRRPPIRALGPSKIVRAQNATAAIIEQMKLSKAAQRSLARQAAEVTRSSADPADVSSRGAEASAPIAPAPQRGCASSERGSIFRDLEASRVSADSPNSRTPVPKEVASKQGRAKASGSRRK